MGVINYLFKRAKKFNKERFEKHIEIISKDTGKSKLYIKFDWLLNFVLYGAGYTDYFRGNYINLTHKEKKTYVTARSFYKILHKLNDPEATTFLSDKIKFNTLFKEYLKRDFIDLRGSTVDELKNFIKGKSVIFAKPIDGFGGHFIDKIVIDENFDSEKAYDIFMSKKQYLIEDAIIQCKELNEINPYAVASFRVVTLYNDGNVYLVANALRINQGKDDVIGCNDDLYFSLNKNGKIDSNVIDDYGNIYTSHPLTNKTFSDVCIPQVEEAFNMCIEAAKKLPKARYIGWDVGFTQNGPCLIEGNEYPGYGIIQFYKLNGSRTGHKKQIEDIVGKI